MGMRNLTTGEGGGSFGNQKAARMGLLGKLAVTISEYEVKYSTKDNSPYIDGKLVVAGSSHFTYFQIFNSKKKPDLVNEFYEAFPEFGMETNVLSAPRQRANVKKDENGKDRTDYSTSLKVFSWGDEFDNARDGFLTGTFEFSEKDTFYKEAHDDKASFAQLKVTVPNTYSNVDDEFVLQATGKEADNAYKVLSDDSITTGTHIYVVATVHGGRIKLISATKSKNQPEAKSGEEEKPAPRKPVGQAAAPAPAPAAAQSAEEPAGVKKGLAGLKKPAPPGATKKPSPWEK